MDRAQNRRETIQEVRSRPTRRAPQRMAPQGRLSLSRGASPRARENLLVRGNLLALENRPSPNIAGSLPVRANRPALARRASRVLRRRQGSPRSLTREGNRPRSTRNTRRAAAENSTKRMAPEAASRVKPGADIKLPQRAVPASRVITKQPLKIDSRTTIRAIRTVVVRTKKTSARSKIAAQSLSVPLPANLFARIAPIDPRVPTVLCALKGPRAQIASTVLRVPCARHARYLLRPQSNRCSLPLLRAHARQ